MPDRGEREQFKRGVIVTVRMPIELAEWLRDEMGGRPASEQKPGWVYQRVLVALIDAHGRAEDPSDV